MRKAYSGVFINSSFNGWCGTCNPMDDADGDGIWELTVTLNPGTIEYKFTFDGWNYQEELAGIEGIEACTLIDGYTNRSLTFDADAVSDAVCWESCSALPTQLGAAPIQTSSSSIHTLRQMMAAAQLRLFTVAFTTRPATTMFGKRRRQLLSV